MTNVEITPDIKRYKVVGRPDIRTKTERIWTFVGRIERGSGRFGPGGLARAPFRTVSPVGLPERSYLRDFSTESGGRSGQDLDGSGNPETTAADPGGPFENRVVSRFRSFGSVGLESLCDVLGEVREDQVRACTFDRQ